MSVSSLSEREYVMGAFPRTPARPWVSRRSSPWRLRHERDRARRAERISAEIVITLDREHFAAVRPRHQEALALVP
jgi:hypothetical protein